MKKLIDLFLNKNTDDSFFEATQYVNHQYWSFHRRNDSSLTEEQLQNLCGYIIEKFSEKYMSDNKTLLHLDDRRLNFYWHVLTRFDPNFEEEMLLNIKSEISSDPLAFSKYLSANRECHTGRGIAEHYDREEAFTEENITMAERLIVNGDIDKALSDELQGFVIRAKRGLAERKLKSTQSEVIN